MSEERNGGGCGGVDFQIRKLSLMEGPVIAILVAYSGKCTSRRRKNGNQGKQCICRKL